MKAVSVCWTILIVSSIVLSLSSVHAKRQQRPNAVASALSQSCKTALNLELVLDGSGSITQTSWDQVKSFSKALAGSFTFAANATIMGIVQFSSNAQVEVPPSSSYDQILTGIQNMQQMAQGTNLYAGINLGQVSLMARARNNTPTIMIIMTDGQSNQGDNPVIAADKAKALGIEIIVIGVGDAVDWNTLNQVASPPAENHRFNIASFDQLEEFLNKLVSKACLRVISLEPSSGPAEGGTAVVVTGEGFENTGKITCKFGDKIVPGVFGDDTHIICKSPAGSGEVTVSISLDGETYSSSSAQFTYITTPTPVGCPNDCSGNGACFNGKCFCNNGWTGPACNQLPCAVADCSGHGQCNNGTCVCQPGWLGPNCDKQACANNCNNHGDCINNTCVCDQGWSGPDCSIGQIICCRYCSAYPNQPWSWLAVCDIGKCGGFPDRKLVESFVVRGAKTKDDCIFHSECIRNTGFCHT